MKKKVISDTEVPANSIISDTNAKVSPLLNWFRASLTFLSTSEDQSQYLIHCKYYQIQFTRNMPSLTLVLVYWFYAGKSILLRRVGDGGRTLYHIKSSGQIGYSNPFTSNKSGIKARKKIKEISDKHQKVQQISLSLSMNEP